MKFSNLILLGLVTLSYLDVAIATDDEKWNAFQKKHRREQFELRAKQENEKKSYREKDKDWAKPGNEQYFAFEEKIILEEENFEKKHKAEACEQFGHLCNRKPSAE